MSTSARQQELDFAFLRMAEAMSLASRCPRGRVGSVLVDRDGRVRSAGFNGHPQKTDCDTQCFRDKCPSGKMQEVRCCEHAEGNCLMFADVHDMKGGTLYCTWAPCTICAGMILQSGVARLVIPKHPTKQYDQAGLEYIQTMTAKSGRLEVCENEKFTPLYP